MKRSQSRAVGVGAERGIQKDMKIKIIAAASVTAVAVAVIAAIVVANPFGQSETMGGEESVHSEGMAALSASNDGEESFHSDGMAALSAANDGEESMHSEGMAPLTVNIEKRIIQRDADGFSSSNSSAMPAKPYIGVAISETERGAVRVLEVLEDGPSNGILRTGDLITAVEGEAIGGSKDLAEAIADAGAGASLALTVTRDGGASDVKVNVGEFSEDSENGIRRYSYSQTFDLPKDGFPMKPSADFDIDVFGEMDKFSDFPMMMDEDVFGKLGEMDDFSDFPMMMMMGEMDKDVFGEFGDMDGFFSLNKRGESGGVARMEKSAVGEDGVYQTHRMAAGTVTNVDAAARTFTLQPQDGSAEITYSVSEDAKTLIAGSGGAGGLAADGETPTLVMDVDGDATLIMQGKDLMASDWEK